MQTQAPVFHEDARKGMCQALLIRNPVGFRAPGKGKAISSVSTSRK